MTVRLLLRLEGLAIAVGAVALYADGDHSWWLFALLILAPDLSFFGIPGGTAVRRRRVQPSPQPRPAGRARDSGGAGDSDGALAVALIWLAHIGVDRLIGYGLKYPTAFKDSHLQRV